MLAPRLDLAHSSRSTRLRTVDPVRTETPRLGSTGNGNLARGSRGEEVAALQRQLNAAVANPPIEVDGKFGPLNDGAVRNFQAQAGIRVDGSFGPQSRAAMTVVNAGGPMSEAGRVARRVGEPAPEGTIPLHRLSSSRNDPARLGETGPGPAGGNRTATFDAVSNQGARTQLVTGRITVNGNTYDFRSGGHGRGSLPPGSYEVTPHLWNRNTPGMTVGGEGYSFALSDKYDSRVGGTRSLLRIHPDGGSAGTQGCIGIVGNAEVQRRFREDMRAELARNGGSFTLNVG